MISRIKFKRLPKGIGVYIFSKRYYKGRRNWLNVSFTYSLFDWIFAISHNGYHKFEIIYHRRPKDE